MENKEKLTSLKESLKIIKKYDNSGDFGYIDELIKEKEEDLTKPVTPEIFNEMVHVQLESYANPKMVLKK